VRVGHPVHLREGHYTGTSTAKVYNRASSRSSSMNCFKTIHWPLLIVRLLSADMAVVAIVVLGWMACAGSIRAQSTPTPEKKLETYYYMIFNDPSPGTEDEWNKWYNEQHQVDVASIPGFKTAQRYAVSENQLSSSKPLTKYLVSYRIVTDDLPSVLKEVQRRLQSGETKPGPAQPTDRNASSRERNTGASLTYRAIELVIYHKGNQPKAVGGETHKYVQIMFSSPATPAQEDEYNRWYRDKYLPELVSSPGWVQCQRFVVSDFQMSTRPPAQWPYKYLAMCEIDTDDLPARILDFKRTDPTLSKNDALGVVANYTYMTIWPEIDGDKVRAERAKTSLNSSQ
jgi:hypothetical protein